MKKFIIVDTWNGEGYSESSAIVKEFESEFKAFGHISKLAIDTVEAHHECKELKIETYSASYTYYYGEQEADDSFNDEDNGCYQFTEFTGQYAVIINPMANEYRLVDTREDFEHQLEQWKKDVQDKEQLDDLNNENFENCFTCLEEGDVIVVLLPLLIDPNDLEIHDSGDGVSYEIWKSKSTKRMYHIPIEIEREWNDAEDVSDKYITSK